MKLFSTNKSNDGWRIITYGLLFQASYTSLQVSSSREITNFLPDLFSPLFFHHHQIIHTEFT